MNLQKNDNSPIIWKLHMYEDNIDQKKPAAGLSTVSIGCDKKN